jgi:hypothetical protein
MSLQASPSATTRQVAPSFLRVKIFLANFFCIESKEITFKDLINHSTSKLFNEVCNCNFLIKFAFVEPLVQLLVVLLPGRRLNHV